MEATTRIAKKIQPGADEGLPLLKSSSGPLNEGFFLEVARSQAARADSPY